MIYTGKIEKFSVSQKDKHLVHISTHLAYENDIFTYCLMGHYIANSLNHVKQFLPQNNIKSRIRAQAIQDLVQCVRQHPVGGQPNGKLKLEDKTHQVLPNFILTLKASTNR